MMKKVNKTIIKEFDSDKRQKILNIENNNKEIIYQDNNKELGPNNVIDNLIEDLIKDQKEYIKNSFKERISFNDYIKLKTKKNCNNINWK
jgi:hypothetical protein